MKTVLLIAAFFVLGFSFNLSIAQRSSFWFKVNSSASFQSQEWKDLSNRFSASSPVQALPASRKIELQKVYEISAEADFQTFEKAFNLLGAEFYSLERGPDYQVLYNPNDFSSQAGVNDYALSLINAPQAWDLTHGDDSVIIAISDQNYDVQHPDLEGKYVHYDANNNLSTTHGTAVAITAAGKTDNAYGISSIGFNVSLALYKMNFNEVLAASYAGCDIINISWSSGCFYSQIEQDIMDEVADNGSFVVAAAGNGFTCGSPNALVYPAAYHHVFSVSSVGDVNNHEQWTGDPTSTHQHNDSVDLCAPGYGVAISPAQGWFIQSSGTSYATAYVSGTVALMLSVNKCLSNQSIETILKSTSFPLDALNPNYAGLLGAGRLDAYAAVLAASNAFDPLQPTFTFVDGCLVADASANLMIQGAQAPYHVSWSNNFLGLNNLNLTSGNYLVQIIDAHGCRLDTTVFVNDEVPPTYDTVVSNPTCFGANNGSLQLTFTNNTQTSVLWSNGTMGSQISGLGSGVYTANITFGNNCTTTQTFSLVAPPALQISGTVTHETLLGNGAVDISVIGGVLPYIYAWSENSQNEDLNNLNAGVYDVLVQDANGCTSTAQFEVLNQTSAEISDNMEDWSVSLYPNPNGGAFTLVLPAQVDFLVQVMDVQGRLVFESKASGFISLNLDLAVGKYLCHVTQPVSGKSVHTNFIVH
jgi:hypothetical protein